MYSIVNTHNHRYISLCPQLLYVINIFYFNCRMKLIAVLLKINIPIFKKERFAATLNFDIFKLLIQILNILSY